MKKFIAVIFLVVVTYIPAFSETFRFAVMSDGRGETRGKTCSGDSGITPLMDLFTRSILDAHAKAKIELLLFPGDLISGYFRRDAATVAECNRAQLISWKNKMEPLTQAGIPIRITAGNHEALAAPDFPISKCGSHLYPYTPKIENFEALYEVLSDMTGENTGPASGLGFTYSFDMGSCHFAVLNAYTLLHANSFSEEIIQWLMKDLADARAAGKKLFVASHPPAFPGSRHMWDSLPLYDPTFNCDGFDPEYGIDRRNERDRFWNILKQNKVTAYLCGHEHHTQIQLVEGVWQVLSGGMTAKLYPLNGAEGDKNPNTTLYDGKFQNPRASINWPWDDDKKSYWGWVLVTVDGDDVKLDVYGSDKYPRESNDFKVIKSFHLREPQN